MPRDTMPSPTAWATSGINWSEFGKKTKIKELTINILIDDSCEMASVQTNHPDIYQGMEGNYWDFHPDCHGIHEYGVFRGYLNFAEVIKSKAIADGYTVMINNGTYSYE